MSWEEKGTKDSLHSQKLLTTATYVYETIIAFAIIRKNRWKDYLLEREYNLKIRYQLWVKESTTDA